MKYLHFLNNKSSNISYYSLFLYLIVPVLVRFGGTSVKFGRAMVCTHGETKRALYVFIVFMFTFNKLKQKACN